jgi:hypothetical protein
MSWKGDNSFQAASQTVGYTIALQGSMLVRRSLPHLPNSKQIPKHIISSPSHITHRLRLHESPSWSCRPALLTTQKLGRGACDVWFRTRHGCIRERGVVAGEVVEHAVCDDEEMFGKVERGGYYEEGKKEEEKRVCRCKLVVSVGGV